MSTAEVVAAVRAGVGLFPMDSRGVIEVRGEDRVRWLDGMISGDVSALEVGPEGAGCYATLLTNRGAVVADLHVGKIGDAFWIESARGQIAHIKETLERFIIADDVELLDRSDDFAAFGLEGPAAGRVLEAILGDAAASGLPEQDQWCEVEWRGGSAKLLIAGFGFSGEAAFQIRLPAAQASALRDAIESASAETATEGGADASPFMIGDEASLEVLRVEAGIPALEAELDGVLPPEARLEHAIATDKGCYVGQEIVARLRSRGQVNHLLVGLRFPDATNLPELGEELQAEGRKTGRVTSRAKSPTEGEIALGFVRREHAEAGTKLAFAAGEAIVSELPFVSLRSGSSRNDADVRSRSSSTQGSA